MTARAYRWCALFIVVALAAFIGWSVVSGMPVYVAVGGVVVAMLLLRLCRRFTKEVMVDERVQRVNEKASAVSYRIFSIVVAILALVLISVGATVPGTFGTVGQTLAYAVCGLMVMHLAFYQYYARKL